MRFLVLLLVVAAAAGAAHESSDRAPDDIAGAAPRATNQRGTPATLSPMAEVLLDEELQQVPAEASWGRRRRRRRRRYNRRRRYIRRRRCSQGQYQARGPNTCYSCGSGRYMGQDGHDNESCHACGGGHWQDGSGAHGCKACPSGKFIATTQATSCKTCAENEYQSSSAQTSCAKCSFYCPAGQWHTECGGSNGGSCRKCPKGKYKTEAGTHQCSECRKGEYQGLEGHLGCLPCHGGQFQDQTAQESCKGCSIHSYCPAGKHHQNCSGASKGSCEACPAGQHKQVDGVDQCTDCEPGRYHGDLGATECKLCEAGRFETGVGSTDCKACDYGCAKGEEKKACGLAEPGTCTQCNLGYSKSVFSTDTCAACVAGKFAAGRGATSCVQCPARTYAPDGAASSCKDCDYTCENGKQLDGCAGPSAGICSNCPKGTWRDGGMTDRVCVACRAGQYKASSGAGHCIPCAPGRYQDGAGAASCRPCPSHTWTDEHGAAECKPVDELKCFEALTFACKDPAHGPCSGATADELAHVESKTVGGLKKIGGKWRAANDVFLKGAYLEVGVAQQGYFGTHVAAPDTFVSFAMAKDGHHISDHGDGLGVIADHHKDGWHRNGGLPGGHALAGDFVMPGSPHDSWTLGYFKDGRKYLECAGRSGWHPQCTNTWSCAVTDHTVKAEGLLSATSVCTNANMRVTHKASFAANKLFVHVDVTVEPRVDNVTSVRYLRNIDPDNDRSLGGTYHTVNTILGQTTNGDRYTGVSAASASGQNSHFALYTKFSQSYARYGGFYNSDPFAPQFNYALGADFPRGRSATADEAIDLMFKLDDRNREEAAGKFEFYMIMDENLVGAKMFEHVRPPCVTEHCTQLCRACPSGAAEEGVFDAAIGAAERAQMAETCAALGESIPQWQNQTLLLEQDQSEGNDREPIDCEAKPWGDWSVCSKTCGAGRQTRTRFLMGEQYGGKPCKGYHYAMKSGIGGDAKVGEMLTWKRVAATKVGNRPYFRAEVTRQCAQTPCHVGNGLQCQCDPRKHVASEVSCSVKCTGAHCRMAILHPPSAPARSINGSLASKITKTFHRCAFTDKTSCACCDCEAGSVHTCAAGESQDVAPPKQLSCKACAVGKFLPKALTHHIAGDLKVRSCIACAPGRYADKTRSAECKPCAPGSIAAGSGNTACHACPAGRSAAAGSDTCMECPAGTSAASGATCTRCAPGRVSATNGAITCLMCASGTFQARQGATDCTPLTTCTTQEYEHVPPTVSSDRVCLPFTACGPHEFEAVAPTAFSDRVCGAHGLCDLGHYTSREPTAFSDRECTALTTCSGQREFESVAATSTSDRVCKPHTQCLAEEFETRPPTPFTDRHCAPKTVCKAHEHEVYPGSSVSDRACAPTRKCTANEFETKAAGTRHDRECRLLTACRATEFETVAPTPTSDRRCSPATPCQGHEFEILPLTLTSDRRCSPLRTCRPSEYESTRPTATSDRNCTKKTVCTKDEFLVTHATDTSDRTCRALTPPCPSWQWQSRAPTFTSDRVCQECMPCPQAGVQRIGCGGKSAGTCTPRECSATEWEHSAPTPTTDRKCLPHTKCVEHKEYEWRAPTATSDRECFQLTVCNSHSYEARPPAWNRDRECAGSTACNQWQHEVQALAPNADRICAPNICSTCADGHPARGAGIGGAHGCLEHGGGTCTKCFDGFKIDNWGECHDVDECSAYTDVCDGHCTNTRGGYECSCEEGEFLSQLSKTTCSPCYALDHCEEVRCSAGGAAAAKCMRCAAGWRVDARGRCVNINECADGANGGCEHLCHDTPGGHACSCRAGSFAATQNATHCAMCTALGHCLATQCTASDDAICTLCADGYDVNEHGHCVNVDECAGDDHGGCDQICSDEEGSHRCSCRSGFYGAETCSACSNIAHCADVRCTGPSDHKCVRCAPGYAISADGTCHDIDECATNNGGCDHYCQNTDGGRTCSCKPHYVQHKNRCVGPVDTLCPPAGETVTYTGNVQHVSENCVGDCSYRHHLGKSELMADFLIRKWHCNTCSPGSHSTAELIDAFAVSGWRTSDAGGDDSEYSLQGSLDNTHWFTLCRPAVVSAEYQQCSGEVARYVRIKLENKGSTALKWSGRIQLQGKHIPRACSGKEVYTCRRDTKLYAGEVQHINVKCKGNRCRAKHQNEWMADFLTSKWHCDTCSPGSHSTAELIDSFYVEAWNIESGHPGSQQWRLEGSSDARSWRVICPATAFDGARKPCTDTSGQETSVRYVRLVKESVGAGPWNGRVQLYGTKDCGISLLGQ